jgi:hypothetical protein
MAGVMSMVANDENLLERFGDLDCAPKKYFKQKLSMR